MDSMSAHLRNLIAEGRKALGREIVVDMDGSHAEDDAMVDDDDEGWNDELTRPQGPEASSRPGPYRPNSFETSTSGNSRRSRKSSPSRRTHDPVMASSHPGTARDSYDLRLAMDRVKKAYGLDP